MTKTISKTDDEWRAELDDERYRVCRQKGTEPPFTGKYWNSKEPGVYVCGCCGNPLFHSASKFDSGTGWPSYREPIADAVDFHDDHSHGMSRVEVTCRRCGAHLGHVFDDGPEPTGKRYCINSISLDRETTGD
jgi:peptide-methionine (R)-S-oxide reductase